MNEFERKVADYCDRNGFFRADREETVLVALSGGGDSVALLTMLIHLKERYGLSVEAAHLNHSLRGSESDEDERFVSELCKEMNVPLTVKKLPAGLLETSRDSVETAAREARSVFLLDTAQKRGATRIATGHTRDDQTETVLHRIIRGTGPSGLAGIPPLRDDMWIRPFLCVTRAEVRDYLARYNMPYREDSTNDDTVYFRNRIRHELLPFIEERFCGGAASAVARLADLSRIQEDYFETLVSEALRSCRVLLNRYKILLEKGKFVDYHNVVKQRVIRRCLELAEGKGRDTDLEEIERILHMIESNDNGTLDVTSTVRCGIGGDIIAFGVKSDTYDPVSIDLPGETVMPQGGGTITAELTGQGVTGDGIVTAVVNDRLRERHGSLSAGLLKPGERMVPFGMNRQVKIRDIASSSPLPAFLRDSITVVRAGAVPIWVPGLRSSELLRLPDNKSPHDDHGDYYLLTYSDGIVWR